MDGMSIGRKAVSGTVWIGTGNIISRAIIFVTGIVLARLLSPEVFGQFAMAIMAVNFLSLFQNPGISQELVQRTDRMEAASDTAFTLALMIGAGLAVAAAPERNRDIIKLGVLLKLAYSGTVLGFWFRHAIPAMWVPFAWCDLAFLVTFVAALRALPPRAGAR
jgi:hypothetical protein